MRPAALRYIRRGLETARDRDLPLALTHVALSGLAKLANPLEDARRLLIADALTKEGVDPSVILMDSASISGGRTKRSKNIAPTSLGFRQATPMVASGRVEI